uniref:Adenine phosphoribosyltransferase n=1 Tax=Pseudodiaptomus poplesia TaxID=213370 RepID=A0A1S6GL48_9MAXI|nr:adenine phosphoribosyltransferase [Pseudodiaptomus poplesia]
MAQPNENVEPSNDSLKKTVVDAIEEYEDFPKPGIKFLDIFSVYRSKPAHEAFSLLLERYAVSVKNSIDAVVGLDSRGFLIGPLIARTIGKPFVPIRKKGKLPGPCHTVKYSLEYGTAEMEIQTTALQKNANVLVVDDLLATGGTLEAACKLIKSCECNVFTCWVAIELVALEGRKLVSSPVESLLQL